MKGEGFRLVHPRLGEGPDLERSSGRSKSYLVSLASYELCITRNLTTQYPKRATETVNPLPKVPPSLWPPTAKPAV